MNNCVLINTLLIAHTVFIFGCSSDDGLQLQEAHRKARGELLLIWSGMSPAGKDVTIYGGLDGAPKAQALPPICAASMLLPQSVFPSKGRYTYLAMCDKTPMFLVRIERADSEKKVNVIFYSAKDHCLRYPERCSESALTTPDLIRESKL